MCPILIAPEYNVKNFLEEQVNLDVMTYLAEGKTYREIGEKIGKKHSFVQSKSRFLRNHGLMLFGRWNVDVNALGMVKTFNFNEYSENSWKRIFEKNFFLSYLSQVKMGKTHYLAMYTFPEEVEDKVGSEITSWYFTFPHFTVPFFRDDFSDKEFFGLYEEENNENTLPPRGKKIDNLDIIDFFICRYVQLETGDINLKEFTDRIKDEIGDIIDVSYNKIRAHFQKLKDSNIIYPIIPLDFTEISFASVYCITSHEKVFKLMKTLNKFNILTGISFIKRNKNLLFIRCPFTWQDTIAHIFDQLDRENEIFFVTKTYVNRGLPYKYYLNKIRE